MAEDLRYWLALREAPGFGNVYIRRLTEALGSARAVFEAGEDELSGSGVLRGSLTDALLGYTRGFDGWAAVDSEIDRATRMGVSLLTLGDESYPALLRNIPDPPVVLYVRGNLDDADRRSVAIVGTRAPSRYGIDQAGRLASNLAGRGLTIVSGLALGIDATAHRAALEAGGRTIAVLGCGLDVIYPQENQTLFFEVMESGAVVSEFPLGTEPDRQNFPRRNRIISGLSLGTVVVEAARGSGSLITAKCALEQDREVFAVPGSVNSPGSKGTNSLLKQGARLVEDADDILAELAGPLKGFLAEAEESSGKAGATADRAGRAVEKRVETPRNREPLTSGESDLLNCVGNEPKQIDVIASEGGLDAARAMSLLLALELKGYVLQGQGMTYIRA